MIWIHTDFKSTAQAAIDHEVARLFRFRKRTLWVMTKTGWLELEKNRMLILSDDQEYFNVYVPCEVD